MTKFLLILVVAVVSAAMASQVAQKNGQWVIIPTQQVLVPNQQVLVPNQQVLVPVVQPPVVPNSYYNNWYVNWAGNAQQGHGRFTYCVPTPAYNTLNTAAYCRVQCSLTPAQCPRAYCQCW